MKLKIIAFVCIFSILITFSGCKYENFPNAPPDNQIGSSTSGEEESSENSTDNNEGEIMQLKINNTIFDVMLENNSTANSFLDILPQSLEMTELNGNEKYCYLNTSLPTNLTRVDMIYAGDIMLWGNNCIVIFYETFSSGYSYSRIGKISDIINLKQCLGSGNVTVEFIK